LPKYLSRGSDRFAHGVLDAKYLGLASHHKLALGRIVRCGVREREHPDMGSFRGDAAAVSFIDLFNLVCFGPDKRNSGMFRWCRLPSLARRTFSKSVGPLVAPGPEPPATNVTRPYIANMANTVATSPRVHTTYT
jgi:hypothetical protein